MAFKDNLKRLRENAGYKQAKDLKKARWYIDKLIEIWEGKVNNKGD